MTVNDRRGRRPLSLLVGEVHTGLLRNSAALPAAMAAQILRLRPAATVRTSTRPVMYALSADLAAGVHCALPTGARAKVEGIGTVVSRASITGGTIAQASSRAVLRTAEHDQRTKWSRYLAMPGVIEVRGKTDNDDLTRGFIENIRPEGDSLEIGALAARLLNRVQGAPTLNGGQSLRARRTRLGFVAHLRAEDEPSVGVEFVIHDEDFRTLSFSTSESDSAAVAGLCEEIALHDWLLTTVLRLVETIRFSAGPGGGGITTQRQAVELLHLWMPAARVPDSLEAVWQVLERRPGFSRQWDSLVAQIRDRIALSLINSMSATGAS